MIDFINELCTKKRYASFYTNYNETDKFHFGVVLATDNENLAIRMISPDGEDDGIMMMNMHNIFRIETDGQYYKKMMRLLNSDLIFQTNFPIKGNDIRFSILYLAENENQIVSIELFDSGLYDIVGFVENISNEKCVIRQLDEYGYDDGTSMVKISDITKVSYSSQSEKRVLKLCQNVTGGL